MGSMFQKSAVATTLGTLLIGFTSAQATLALPEIHENGSVQYLTGGVGADQSSAIERVSKQWPLTLEFAVKDKHRADFAADVKTVVRDAKGSPVIQLDSAGPFVLAKLAPGQYSVDATLGGRTLHEKVVVKRGQPAKAVFLWPAATGNNA